ncbi:MAG: alpha-L-rhamnosidase N-terminal domain-containing protein, partial [Eubacteriales bacterium]
MSSRFSKTIRLKKEVKKAKLCVSAMGLYAAFLDGKRIGEGVLTPSFTSYDHRTQYQTYDVTDK